MVLSLRSPRIASSSIASATFLARIGSMYRTNLSVRCIETIYQPDARVNHARRRDGDLGLAGERLAVLAQDDDPLGLFLSLLGRPGRWRSRPRQQHQGPRGDPDPA